MLVLYHELFRHPVSLTARTSEGAECFPTLCSLLGSLCHAKGAGAIMAEEMRKIDDAAAETRQEKSLENSAPTLNYFVVRPLRARTMELRNDDPPRMLR